MMLERSRSLPLASAAVLLLVVEPMTILAVPPPVLDPAARRMARSMLATSGLLLVPDSTNNRVMAFDPMTGDLVDPDFVPADPDHLTAPIHAILGADGESILLSDQFENVVHRYDFEGNHLGVFAPSGGPDDSILFNIRGIALAPNGHLLVTVGAGVNRHAVAEFDTTGEYLGNFVDTDSGGLISPFDILEVSVSGGALTAGEFLVAGAGSNAIHHYDPAGNPLADLAPIDGFPEQMQQLANGNLLLANHVGSQQGVVELDPNGTVIGIYNAALGGYRGVYELPTSTILTTGFGIHEIDRSGALVESKFTGVQAGFIELVRSGTAGPPVVEIPTLDTVGIGLLAALLLVSAASVLRRRSPPARSRRRFPRT